MRQVSQEPIRILIFGQSNTRGVQLGEGDVAWPDLVAAALPELTGKPAQITVRPFFAHAPGSDAYLAREVQQREPDIVFLMLTTFSFANRVIEPGVRRRFGERAGNAYSTLAGKFDAATRGRGRLAGKLNEAGRALALRVFPAESVTTYEVALEGTTKALQLLARQEHVQVVAVHGFVKLPKRRSGKPSQKEAVVDRFLDEMRAVTGRLHITFINLHRKTIPESWYMPDGLHVSGEAHKAIAAAVLEAFRDGRIRS